MAEDINLGLAKLDLSMLITPQPRHQRKGTKGEPGNGKALVVDCTHKGKSKPVLL